jgi:hypothetical protein
MKEISDAAWFYSSLAQVSASIFGIIGAVFATRLSDYTRETIAVHDAIQRAIGVCYGNLKNHALVMAEENHYHSSMTHRDRQALAHAVGLFRGLTGRVDVEKIDNLIETLTANQEGVTAPFATSHLTQHVPWLVDVRRQLRSFRKIAFPHALWAMWGLLAWLTGVGVIWPMMALPGLDGAWFSKTYILALFSLGAVAFVLFLLWELIRLWGLTRDFFWR